MTPEPNQIYTGDCLDVMKGWPESFVDTVITDPPYGLSFMGKDWDHGVPGVHYWEEVLRIAKPGAMLLAFGGTRTYHRLAVAIEDAGWEIRDCLMWLYGSGFPKSLDISKAIDKAKGAERIKVRTPISPRSTAGKGTSNEIDARPWLTKAREMGYNESDGKDPITDTAKAFNGWGTALKPAWEPILLAMKPLDGTFAENAEKWGVAGLNVDGGRIGIDDNEPNRRPNGSIPLSEGGKTSMFKMGGRNPENNGDVFSVKGRWPANLLLDEEAARMLDGVSGASTSPPSRDRRPDGPALATWSLGRVDGIQVGHNDAGGASRFFYVAKAASAERNEGCEEMPAQNVNDGRQTSIDNPYQRGDTLRSNTHPTVKPLDLMKYLVNLTRTPTGGLVLDPFCGSGTTLWAAESHNRPWLGIELNPEYALIAQARLANERAQLKLTLEPAGNGNNGANRHTPAAGPLQEALAL